MKGNKCLSEILMDKLSHKLLPLIDKMDTIPCESIPYPEGLVELVFMYNV